MYAVRLPEILSELTRKDPVIFPLIGISQRFSAACVYNDLALECAPPPATRLATIPPPAHRHTRVYYLAFTSIISFFAMGKIPVKLYYFGQLLFTPKHTKRSKILVKGVDLRTDLTKPCLFPVSTGAFTPGFFQAKVTLSRAV